MFGDLDWPTSASRRFVSISWASCFVLLEDQDANVIIALALHSALLQLGFLKVMTYAILLIRGAFSCAGSLAGACQAACATERTSDQQYSVGHVFQKTHLQQCTVQCHCDYNVSILVLQQYVTRSSADADKPARCACRSVKVTKHSNTIPYVRYSFPLCNSNFVFKTRRFYDIRLQKMSWPWNWGQMSLKDIESDIIR